MNLEQRRVLAADRVSALWLRRDVMTAIASNTSTPTSAIVGSGFAGSLTALALRRRGRRVALIERGRHPRFAIGESSTPLANLLLEELADRYDLPRIRPFSKWGTWQRDAADVACGLKRGFTFFFHRPGEPFADDAEHERQLLVAASPHDEIADTHWYRPDFDHALVARGRSRRRDLSRRDAPRSHAGRWRPASVLEGTRERSIRPHLGAVRGRRQRAARIPAPGARPR